MSQQLKIEDEIIITIAADLSSSSVNTSSSSNTFNDSINEIINSTNESDASSSNEEACDILFPLYQLLMHGRRRSKVQGFLDTVHLYTDAVFKEHFRLQRQIAYLQIGISNIIVYYLYSLKIRMLYLFLYLQTCCNRVILSRLILLVWLKSRLNGVSLYFFGMLQILSHYEPWEIDSMYLYPRFFV